MRVQWKGKRGEENRSTMVNGVKRGRYKRTKNPEQEQLIVDNSSVWNIPVNKTVYDEEILRRGKTERECLS